MIRVEQMKDLIICFLNFERYKLPCSAKKYTKWKGDVVGLVFEQACRLSDKPL